jgi:hypothetical protein
MPEPLYIMFVIDQRQEARSKAESEGFASIMPHYVNAASYRIARHKVNEAGRRCSPVFLLRRAKGLFAYPKGIGQKNLSGTCKKCD